MALGEKPKLLATNFLLGFLPLALEVLAIRALAPVVGTSIVSTSLCIGAIIICLSFGYYLASRFENHDPENLVKKGFLLSAALVFVSPFLLQALKYWAGDPEYTTSFFAKLGIVAFLGPVLIAGLASIVLGMCSPVLFELLRKEIPSTRHTAAVAFISSGVGGLFGSMAPTLFLIPVLGVNRSFIALFVLLGSAAVLISLRENKRRFLGVAGVLLSACLADDALRRVDFLPAGTFAKYETTYQTVYLKNRTFMGTPISTLEYDVGFGWQSIFDEDFSALRDPYYAGMILFFNKALIAPRTEPRTEPFTAAVLGSAGATMSRHAVKVYDGRISDFTIYNVDIDGALHDIAKERFHAESPHARFVSQDALGFVRTTRQKFDYVMIDAFSQGVFIPSELLTVEFFAELKSVMKNDGVVQINVFAASEDSELVEIVLGGLQRLFPHTYVMQAPAGTAGKNYLISASSASIDFPKLAAATPDFAPAKDGVAGYTVLVHPAARSGRIGRDDMLSSELLVLKSFWALRDRIRR